VEISAHARHSAPAENYTIEVCRQALATNADYVEFDIRRTADEELVAFHNACTRQGIPLSTIGYAQLCDLAGYEVPKVTDILATVKGRAKGHLDLKEQGYEEKLVRLALDVLGPGEFIVTTLEDASVAGIRSRFPNGEEVPVALSIGRGMQGMSRAVWVRDRFRDLRPMSRVQASGAEWVAIDHRVALSGVLPQLRAKRLKIMVWTVNNEREIRYWLARQQIDVLVTDRAAFAVETRDLARVLPVCQRECAPAPRGTRAGTGRAAPAPPSAHRPLILAMPEDPSTVLGRLPPELRGQERRVRGSSFLRLTALRGIPRVRPAAGSSGYSPG
jgi:glycerophosphoryl diester phosphodiesterase